MSRQLSHNSPEIEQATAGLIASAGWFGKYDIHPLPGGANNRVFRVEVDGSCALLKSYFYHPSDPRDRLGTEFTFSTFAWESGLRRLPRPFACDLHNRLGLYEFLQGRRLTAGEILEEMVDQALDFYKEINQFRRLPQAGGLPLASEASFTISDHLQRVEARLRRLRCAQRLSALDHAADSFIRDELYEVWRRVVNHCDKQSKELGLSLETEIALEDRRLSPSDFGFHNAILVDESHLRFIDFEYAGWDDPAKIVCDFFCQPEVPVSLDYFDRFLKSVTADLSHPEMHCQRIALLLPVYQVKWCCIRLNDFLPIESKRRRFARTAAGIESQKSEQLQKARRALDMIRWKE